MSDKVIISCALTGAVIAKQLCPAIPYTPVEIADEAKRIPSGARWKVIGISREQWPLCMAALALGGAILWPNGGGNF